MAITVTGQTVTMLYEFGQTSTSPAWPNAGLIQGLDGNL